MTSHLIGSVHSIQSLGTVDGPGVRFVVFLQGCNLRCSCCHNPDTWSISGGSQYAPPEIVDKVLKYREYFGKDGGITFSGGEPLLQAAFVREVFELCNGAGINTCLDTSGSILDDSVKRLLDVTDRVLLDIKYTEDEMYRKYVGCKMENVIRFLSYLNEKNIPTTLRQVIIPSLNDNEENIIKLKEIIKQHKCIDKTELLPFRKICQTKYDMMKTEFPLAHIPEPSDDTMIKLNKILKDT